MDPFEMPYMKKKIREEENLRAVEKLTSKDIEKKRTKRYSKTKEDVESALEEKIKGYKGNKKQPTDEETVLRAKEAMAREIKLKKMRAKILHGKEIKPEDEEEIELTEEDIIEEPEEIKSDEKDIEIVQPEKAEEEIEVKDEDVVSKEPIDEDRPVIEHLRNSLSNYPELVAPEIKKNIDTIKKQDEIIAKNETIIEKNEASAKKSAREKVRTAKEAIKKAQDVISRAKGGTEDYIADIAAKFNEESRQLAKLAEEYSRLQEKIAKKYNGYDIGAKGIFGGIGRFFKERKLKKQLDTQEYEELLAKKIEYKEAFLRHDELLKKHGKQFGRMEDALYAGHGKTFAGRGSHSELRPPKLN